MPISPIPELVAELAAGRMVILVDEEDRENEGDLVLAADHGHAGPSTSWPSMAAA
jgi:3,4-dihydroxy 2-butanone 4-phosphate synthase/GTP cyclohydrolase II